VASTIPGVSRKLCWNPETLIFPLSKLDSSNFASMKFVLRKGANFLQIDAKDSNGSSGTDAALQLFITTLFAGRKFAMGRDSCFEKRDAAKA